MLSKHLGLTAYVSIVLDLKINGNYLPLLLWVFNMRGLVMLERKGCDAVVLKSL